MNLNEAITELEEHGYEVKSLNEDFFSILFGMGLVFLIKALCRAYGSHKDTQKLKMILNGVKNDELKCATNLVKELQNKIIHRPIEELNDDELAEATERLVELACPYKSIHKDCDDKLFAYNDEGYGSIKDKISNNLDEVYKIVYDLFFNLIKLKLDTDNNITKNLKKYKHNINDAINDITILTTTRGNFKRAYYMAHKGTYEGERNTPQFKKWLTKKKYPNKKGA